MKTSSLHDAFRGIKQATGEQNAWIQKNGPMEATWDTENTDRQFNDIRRTAPTKMTNSAQMMKIGKTNKHTNKKKPWS